MLRGDRLRYLQSILLFVPMLGVGAIVLVQSERPTYALAAVACGVCLGATLGFTTLRTFRRKLRAESREWSIRPLPEGPWLFVLVFVLVVVGAVLGTPSLSIQPLVLHASLAALIAGFVTFTILGVGVYFMERRLDSEVWMTPGGFELR